MVALCYQWLFLWYSCCSLAGSKAEPAAPAAIHPFYISVTEVTLNNADQTLEVSCKLFADDLEQVLEKNNHAELDITTGRDKASFDRMIPAYIKNHLSLVIDGKPRPLSYIGFETEKESAYCYFQVDHVASLKKLDITNTLLHDFTADQINIIHVMVNGKRQSTKLDYPSATAGFSF